jgi:type I site-specific restriction-modification system R (restriction) subunit
LLFNCQQPVDLFAHSTRSAALGQRAILPTEYSAAVYTGTNNDPAHMKKGHLDEKEEQRIPKDLFSNPGELPKIPIVRGKLLTGYDAPVLYAIRARR